MTKSSQEAHQTIQKNAKESIEKAQVETIEAQKARQSAEQALNTLQFQWQVLSHDHNIAITQLDETQKQQMIVEEANKSLESQLKELKKIQRIKSIISKIKMKRIVLFLKSSLRHKSIEPKKDTSY